MVSDITASIHGNGTRTGSGLTGGGVQHPAVQQAPAACEGRRLHGSETSDALQPETAAPVLLTQLTDRQVTAGQAGRLVLPACLPAERQEGSDRSNIMPSGRRQNTTAACEGQHVTRCPTERHISADRQTDR